MSTLTERLGPAVFAYGRKGSQSPDLLDGECEDFSGMSDDKSNNGSPAIDLGLKDAECTDIYKLPEKKKYLWIIDEFNGELRLRLIPEQTENKHRVHKAIVCHSNLTACGQALQGGECWWCDETKRMFVNPKSGRYGATTVVQWVAVLEYFGKIGFNVVNTISPEWKLT